MERRAFLAGTGAVLLVAPLTTEGRQARNEVRHLAQEPPPSRGLVCPGNTYWNGHGCTSGRRPPAEDQYVEIVPGKTTKEDSGALRRARLPVDPRKRKRGSELLHALLGATLSHVAPRRFASQSERNAHLLDGPARTLRSIQRHIAATSVVG